MRRYIKTFVLFWIYYFVGINLFIGGLKWCGSGWDSLCNSLADYGDVLGPMFFVSVFGAFCSSSGVPSEDADSPSDPLFIPSENFSIPLTGVEGRGPGGTHHNPATGLPMINTTFDVGGNCFGTGPDF